MDDKSLTGSAAGKRLRQPVLPEETEDGQGTQTTRTLKYTLKILTIRRVPVNWAVETNTAVLCLRSPPDQRVQADPSALLRCHSMSGVVITSLSKAVS